MRHPENLHVLFLRKLGAAAARRASNDLGMNVHCECLGQYDVVNERYNVMPSDWVIHEGNWPSQVVLTWQWTVPEHEICSGTVTQSFKHAQARGVRRPESLKGVVGALETRRDMDQIAAEATRKANSALGCNVVRCECLGPSSMHSERNGAS